MELNYNQLANEEVIEKTTKVLEQKGYKVTKVKSGVEALEKIKLLIPEGKSVMNGSSATLEQIGYLSYLGSGGHKWVNLHAKITAESDKEKRTKLRREATLADYYLGSVHALTQNGEFVIASNTGSQLPHVVYTSPNLIFVVSTKKIVVDLDMGLKRLREHVFPLEDKHSMEKYSERSAINKIVIFNGEVGYSGRGINFILVEEDLGF